MKILHFHTHLPAGGIEAMICGLANTMADLGEDVTVGTIFAPKAKDVFWNRLNPSVKRFTLGKVKEGFSVVEIFRIYMAIVRGHYDVVNLHGRFYYFFLSVIFLHRHVKFIYTVHSDATRENSSWDAHFFPLKKYCFKKGWMKAVTISEISQGSFRELYHCESRMIYNGVPKPTVLRQPNIVDDKRITAQTKVFIHPGRITEAKNQVVLCKIFKRLISDQQDVVLLIAGNIQEPNIYEQLLPFFSERIIYIGERNDIPELMSRADGLCLCSIWEGLPVTLLEALSVGCIPICSPVGGIVNVINDGDNGILSVSPSEADYYEAMNRYLGISRKKLQQMKECCIKTFESYDISKTTRQYIDFYSEQIL